jgi:hypothetical protein
MKSMLGLSLMMASLSMANHNNSPRIRDEYLPKETEEQKRKKQKAIDKKINEAKGLKEFFYNSNSLWALNQKSADKKANKKGWIKLNKQD